MNEMAAEKDRASAWFGDLRDAICAAFEMLEDEQTTGSHADLPPGRFERKATKRAGEGADADKGGDQGGGVMSVLREGRCFEKVGVNISTVYGQLAERAQRSLTARKEIPGLSDDPRFWASGISLVAHMRSPKCPAVHMNTRMFWTPGSWWFGGGSDLNPMVEEAEDTGFFHQTLKTLLVNGTEEGSVVALVLRGDHVLNEIKAEKLEAVAEPFTFADEAAIKAAAGCSAGSIGPVGLEIPVIAPSSPISVSLRSTLTRFGKLAR